MIGGCSTNLSTIVIELSPEEVKQLQSTKSLQTFLTLSNLSVECSSSLEDVTLSTQVPDGCRKVETKKVVTDNGKTLGAYFTVDSSGCNRWWIILVSVIAALVVLGVVAAIVVRVVWLKKREERYSSRLDHNGK